MSLHTKERAELKSFFKRRNIPTEDNFADLIDACINYADDGLLKKEGSPLSIESVGDEVSQKRVLNFYNSFEDDQPSWSFSLKPRTNQTDISSAKAGLSIGDATGQSRLFIERDSSRVGLGTLDPSANLHIHYSNKQSTNDNLLCVGNASGSYLSVRNHGISSLYGQNNKPSTLRLQSEGGRTVIGGNLAITGVVEQEDWKSPKFNGAWATANSQEVAGYYKDALGIVHMRGSVLEWDSNISGFGGHVKDALIATLPLGYRPATDLVFIVMGDARMIRLDVQKNGEIRQLLGNWGDSRFFSLCGVSFRAAI